ncbi:FAS1-like dehydratase domain-containing protein [Georgenia sp. Z1344]|uniref:FAS1-like dehydratase domain-containing protein n=1 Tax=Georgenia sp. Z1344 TaxID=3416706 RepID=UPI003CFABB38
MTETPPRPAGVDTTLAGRTYAPTETYVVSAAKIAEMAVATGATHPLHTDAEAARAAGYPGVVAPPTFAVILAQRAEQAYVASPESGIDFSRVVHADERLSHHRPIVDGDRLRTTVVVERILARGALTLVTTRADIAEEGTGDPVATVTSTLAVRGDA